MVYRYAPFHRFEISFTPAVVEPLVFFNSTGSGTSLVINPDLWLFFELEEKTSGIWWDPPKGVEVVRQHVIKPGEVEIVEIRVEYLRKYLQAGQMALPVEHIRRVQLYNPPQEMIDRFGECTLTLGSPGQGMKAIINSDHREDVVLSDPLLLRTLRLWFQVTRPPIDIEDPWAEEPLFDPYTFTLFTDDGPVAPGRWAYFRQIAGRKFDGVVCGFMTPVFFRQEVLEKYQGASGFDVRDDGSVSCYGEWSTRTWRLGNELLATAIGDFAKGVPFYEWPHWRQYAVEPPSSETVAVLNQE